MEIFVAPETRKTKAELQDEAVMAVANSYSRGELSKDDLIVFLAELPYKLPQPDSYGDASADMPGSFDIVIRLLDDGIISPEIYDSILAARRAAELTS